MQYPELPEEKSAASEKEARAGLMPLIERAAGDLNPLLVTLAIGLMILNLTLFLGLAASRQSIAWMNPNQVGAAAAGAASVSIAQSR
jgi:hypothetical protein